MKPFKLNDFNKFHVQDWPYRECAVLFCCRLIWVRPTPPTPAPSMLIQRQWPSLWHLRTSLCGEQVQFAYLPASGGPTFTTKKRGILNFSRSDAKLKLYFFYSFTCGKSIKFCVMEDCLRLPKCCSIFACRNPPVSPEPGERWGQSLRVLLCRCLTIKKKILNWLGHEIELKYLDKNSYL
jgi:hypothetical protein